MVLEHDHLLDGETTNTSRNAGRDERISVKHERKTPWYTVCSASARVAACARNESRAVRAGKGGPARSGFPIRHWRHIPGARRWRSWRLLRRHAIYRGRAEEVAGCARVLRLQTSSSAAASADERRAPESLLGMGETALTRLARDMGQPSYRGKQMHDAIYNMRKYSVDDMTQLPGPFRAQLTAAGVVVGGGRL